jgi:uncharacterized glyoxalase superfamily protein PhnB
MMMKYPIRTIGWIVDSVEDSVNFYQEKLGYSLTLFKPGEFALFDAYGSVFFFWQRSHLNEHFGADVMAHVKHSCMAAIKFDTPKEVDAACTELKSRGVNFLVEPNDWPWDARAAYFIDDHGYIWELFAWIGGDERPTAQWAKYGKKSESASDS